MSFRDIYKASLAIPAILVLASCATSIPIELQTQVDVGYEVVQIGEINLRDSPIGFKSKGSHAIPDDQVMLLVDVLDDIRRSEYFSLYKSSIYSITLGEKPQRISVWLRSHQCFSIEPDEGQRNSELKSPTIDTKRGRFVVVDGVWAGAKGAGCVWVTAR